jgi:hypothetical protein
MAVVSGWWNEWSLAMSMEDDLEKNARCQGPWYGFKWISESVRPLCPWVQLCAANYIELNWGLFNKSALGYKSWVTNIQVIIQHQNSFDFLTYVTELIFFCSFFASFLQIFDYHCIQLLRGTSELIYQSITWVIIGRNLTSHTTLGSNMLWDMSILLFQNLFVDPGILSKFILRASGLRLTNYRERNVPILPTLFFFLINLMSNSTSAFFQSLFSGLVKTVCAILYNFWTHKLHKRAMSQSFHLFFLWLISNIIIHFCAAIWTWSSSTLLG